MSESIMPATNVTTVSTPNAANPTTAGAVASSNGGGEPSSSTTIGSMKDLKTKAPKLYNSMMQGIGMNICNEMKHHQERLKTMMREGNRH